MERGVIPVADNVAAVVADVPVTDGERCSILRRRFKKTLADAAEETRLHEHVLSEMERGLRTPVAPEYEEWLIRLEFEK